MQSFGQYLQNLAEQELRLPEVNADACVYSFYDRSDCNACVQACPSQAWILDDDSLGLDSDACDGCGLCVPACPGGALSLDFPYVIRQFGGHLMALFACSQSGVDRNLKQLPCIDALGLRQLLLLYNSGIRHLLVARGECSDCQYHQSSGLDQRLQQLNVLLQERNQPAMKMMLRSGKLWEKIYRTDEVISRGTQLSRRQFLRGKNKAIRQNMLLIDPLNLAESQTVPAGELLPETTAAEVHWPWAPNLDASQCSGCDACINLCPTGALQLIWDEENTAAAYQLNPAKCNGCGICVAVCESKAMSLQNFALSSVHDVTLKQQNCSACGNSFHLPREEGQMQNKLCRICETRNHNRNLFQVLTDD